MQLARALRWRSKDVVSFVGGGGKTSAMFRLAGELAAHGRRVVTTTTTHIFASQIALAGWHIVHPPSQSIHELLDLLAGQLVAHPHILVVAPPDADSGKALGVSPDLVAAIAAMPQVDGVLVEADGARMRPFKAPADHEPVVAACTTVLVPVVGVDAVGLPLTAEVVHRPERVARITGAEPGAALTPQIMAAALVHAEGGLKGRPPGARVVPLINKVAGGQFSPALAAARDLADHLLACKDIEAVVLGAVQESDPVLEVRGRVAAVVLAAGGARRYGALKQMLSWGSGTLLSQVVDTALASQADPVVVLLGSQAAACRSALGERPVTVVVNRDWERGQSSSLKVGLAALPGNVMAAVFPLADQPRVTAATLDALIERHRATLAPVVWPEYKGERGNPVLFDRDLFPELMQLTGDVGGRALLGDTSALAERVDVPDAGILLDIDTPQDYRGAGGNE